MPQGNTVLLVEDDALIRFSIADLLASEGHHVETACDGASGIAMLRRAADELKALVTDIELGEGPSVWEIARLARRLRQDLPVIYMSGACREEWEARGVFPSRFFSKPIAEKELLTALA